MKKIFLGLTLSSFFFFSQSQDRVASIVSINGSNFNPSDSVLNLFSEGLLSDDFLNIPMKNGEFSIVLDLDTKAQPVSLLFEEDDYKLICKPGDVIYLIGDGRSDSLTELRAQSEERTRQLNFGLHIWPSREVGTLWQQVQTTTLPKDSSRYAVCWKGFQEQLENLNNHREEIGDLMDHYVNEYYFNYIRHLTISRLQYSELLIPPSAKYQVGGLLPAADHYKELSKELLWLSPAYRQFVFDATRSIQSDTSNQSPKVVDSSFNIARSDFESGNALADAYVRDWYQAKSILFSLKSYEAKVARQLYDEYLSTHRNAPLTALLIAEVDGYANLVEGESAPPFTLADPAGKMHKLTDFKGAAVYLNFWGVHCPPCLSEMKIAMPLLRKQYPHLKIVTVCIEGTREEWLTTIERYKMGDYTNLYDANQAAMSTYNIQGIPHNLWIDPAGNLFKYQARYPADLSGIKRDLKIMEAGTR